MFALRQRQEGFGGQVSGNGETLEDVDGGRSVAETEDEESHGRHPEGNDAATATPT
ncbi:hypothetical protein DVS28_a4639 [Euzebya pacifica]|uniref:Uncharacterized protein n=1 Tax=Euzebya pacifica TaxID=1608957 RepID=A0A346Y4A3_9ACTN|nr:hypothetical protein DVS28_a4639 [Euzebya pacifica]